MTIGLLILPNGDITDFNYSGSEWLYVAEQYIRTNGTHACCMYDENMIENRITYVMEDLFTENDPINKQASTIYNSTKTNGSNEIIRGPMIILNEDKKGVDKDITFKYFIELLKAERNRGRL